MDDFELIIDTADLDSIRLCDEVLDVQGVTTNPTIITRTGKPAEQAIADLVAYLRPDQKLFVQVVATDFDGIMSEARHIASLRPENTYPKIPVTHAGLRAIKQCRAEGIPTLATAIYSSDAAFMAAHNGADYLATYVNRMCNYGDGVQDVIDLIGKDRLKAVVTERGSEAAWNEDYELSRDNVLDCWLNLICFAIVFAALSVIALEFIDKDKR